MNITTYSKPESYVYEGYLATYFPDTYIKKKDGILQYPIILTLEKNAIWMGNPIDFNDPFDCRIPVFQLNQTDQNLSIEEVNAMFIKGKGLGVRCFVRDDKTKENDQLMWSHYANKGNGICLVFNPELDKEFFAQKDIVGVEYVSKAEPLIIPIDIRNLKEKDPAFKIIKCYSFGIKGEKWSYENEVRVIKELFPYKKIEQFFNESISEVGWRDKKSLQEKISSKIENYILVEPSLRYYSFKKESLVEIRFGHAMEKKRINEIKTILSDNGYGHVLCKLSTPDAKNFQIEYHDC